jgi:hypothetical protein
MRGSGRAILIQETKSAICSSGSFSFTGIRSSSVCRWPG